MIIRQTTSSARWLVGRRVIGPIARESYAKAVERMDRKNLNHEEVQRFHAEASAMILQK